MYLSHIHYIEDTNVLHVYLKKQFKEEFSKELFENSKKTDCREEFAKELMQSLEEKYPLIKDVKVKIMTGSVVLGKCNLYFPISPAALSKQIMSAFR